MYICIYVYMYMYMYICIYVYMYICIYVYVLGALTLEQRVKRWLASCGFDRGTRTGKLEQPNARRER